MINLQIEAATRACLRDDIDSLMHLIPSFLEANSRVPKIRIGDRPHSAVPFLCVAISAGSVQCFDYLIEMGATTYFADLFDVFFGFSTLH